jgi:hypothetical protein
VANLLSLASFVLTPQQVIEILALEGGTLSDLRGAMDALKPYINARSQYVELFHSSFQEFVRSTNEYISTKTVLLARVAKWLEHQAPEPLRWAHLNRIRYFQGDASPLLETVNRQWAVSAVADARPSKEIIDQVDWAAHASMERKTFGSAFVFDQLGAVLMSDDVYNSVHTSLHRAIVHTSTFSENSLAMRAGLATLDVLESERLGAWALSMGQYLRQRLQDVLAGYEMVKEVRGVGLFCGVEFQAPRQWALRAPYETFRRIHPGMFGQMLVMNLFRDKGILTQICGNNFQVLKVAPPLVVTEGQIDEFVSKLGEVVESIHSSTTFWSEALGLARRVVNI